MAANTHSLDLEKSSLQNTYITDANQIIVKEEQKGEIFYI